MAKNDTTQLILLVGGGYLLYMAAEANMLGPKIKKKADKVRAAVKAAISGSLYPIEDITTDRPDPVPGVPDNQQPYGTYSPDLTNAIAALPDFIDQMNNWIGERAANGQNSCAWGQFRNHQIAIGAPDPGSNPPPEFFESCRLA